MPPLRDPGLLAVEHVVVAVASRGAAERGDVGAGVGLGECEGGDRFAGGDAGQIGALLLLGAVERDGAGAEPLHGEGEIGESGMPRQRLAQSRQMARVSMVSSSAAIGGAADGIARPAGFAERAHQRAAFGIDVVVVAVGNVRRRPGVELRRERCDGDPRKKASRDRSCRSCVAGPVSCPRTPASASPRRRDRRDGSPASSCTPPAPAPRRRSLRRRPSPIPDAACAW